MSRYVVDSSAAVEFLLKTPTGLRVAEIVRSASFVGAPHLLDAEVLSTVRRLLLTRRVSSDVAEATLLDLRSWRIHRLLHRPLVEDAWALRANVSAYDALFVAAARLRRATLLTADGRLYRAPGVDVTVLDVRAER